MVAGETSPSAAAETAEPAAGGHKVCTVDTSTSMPIWTGVLDGALGPALRRTVERSGGKGLCTAGSGARQARGA